MKATQEQIEFLLFKFSEYGATLQFTFQFNPLCWSFWLQKDVYHSSFHEWQFSLQLLFLNIFFNVYSRNKDFSLSGDDVTLATDEFLCDLNSAEVHKK